MHTNYHAIMCRVRGWDICCKCGRSDQLHRMHNVMFSWTIHEWAVHCNYITNLRGMRGRNICTVCRCPNSMHCMHHKLCCWTVHERLLHIHQQPLLQRVQCWLILCVYWRTDIVHHMCSWHIPTRHIADCLCWVYVVMLCWPIHVRDMHYNNHRSVQWVCGWHLFAFCWHADSMHDMHNELHSWTVHLRLVYKLDHASLQHLLGRDLCAISWHSDSMHLLHQLMRCW